MKKIDRLFVVVLCFIIAGMSAGCDKKLKTVVIKPDSKRFYYYTGEHDDNAGAFSMRPGYERYVLSNRLAG